MFRLIKLMIWIVVISGGIFYWNYSSFISNPLKNTKTITIEEGDSFYKVFGKIYEENTLFLKIFFRKNPEKIDFSLPKGTYTFSRGDSIEMILEKLQKGTLPIQTSLRTLPGWNIFDIDKYLIEKELIEKGEFITEAKNISKYKESYVFLENALSLEGFLYPDTHFVLQENFSLENYMHLLLKNFERKVYTPLLSEKTPKEIIDIINMASIVEKEAFPGGGQNEKDTIAGILTKRLKERWYIGADITVCYPYELTENECRLSVSKYITQKNDYNTRTKLGLPKTPINNPQLSSIQASISPKDTQYYFYLHDKSGKIHYARTNDEHNRNKALYLR